MPVDVDDRVWGRIRVIRKMGLVKSVTMGAQPYVFEVRDRVRIDMDIRRETPGPDSAYTQKFVQKVTQPAVSRLRIRREFDLRSFTDHALTFLARSKVSLIWYTSSFRGQRGKHLHILFCNACRRVPASNRLTAACAIFRAYALQGIGDGRRERQWLIFRRHLST